MSGTDISQETPAAGHLEALVEWRGAVESFFENEWEQLRTLILELEVEQWDEPELPESTPTSQPVSSVTEQNILRETPVERTITNVQSNIELHDGRPVSFADWNTQSTPAGDGDRQDRLAELAQNLERRLQGTDSSPTTHDRSL